MLPQSRLDKISEMENLLNEAESFLADAEQFLEKWQAFLLTQNENLRTLLF